VQSQVLNLMVRLQRELGLTYVFISHDLSVVEHVSDAVAIMYLGRIVEQGPVDLIFGQPAHPYTRALMQAIPSTNPRQRREAVPLQGETPSPTSIPPGCVFSSRCPFAVEACRQSVPPLATVGVPAEFVARTRARWHPAGARFHSESTSLRRRSRT
jgi:dipeptide transport system ATP-binding protein